MIDISTTEPALPSERCGVSSAQNSVGSASGAVWALLSVMRSSLYRRHGPQDDPPSRKEASRESKAREAQAVDRRGGRGGVPPLQEGEPGADHGTSVGQSLHAAGRRGALGAGDRRRGKQGGDRP